jgi:hypothetical protein
VALLNDGSRSAGGRTSTKRKATKGERRIGVTCDEIEQLVFGSQRDPNEMFRCKKDGATRPSVDEEPWTSVDMQDDPDPNSDPDEPPTSRLNDQEKQLAGQRRAEEREMVRRAARRGVVFGFALNPHSPSPLNGANQIDSAAPRGQNDAGFVRRKCEALMNGAVVEPSFAKGNWAIRWRE